MPAAGVPLTLWHFKEALKACETATSRALEVGAGSTSSSSSGLSAAQMPSPLSASSSSSGSGGVGVDDGQAWEVDVAAAVGAVPVIFELIRETADVSPDDCCYSSAMR